MDYTFSRHQVGEKSWKFIIIRLAKTGENVEDAFLETARQIYQKIQDGSLELNAADSGVQTRSQVSTLVQWYAGIIDTNKGVLFRHVTVVTARQTSW